MIYHAVSQKRVSQTRTDGTGKEQTPNSSSGRMIVALDMNDLRVVLLCRMNWVGQSIVRLSRQWRGAPLRWKRDDVSPGERSSSWRGRVTDSLCHKHPGTWQSARCDGEGQRVGERTCLAAGGRSSPPERTGAWREAVPGTMLGPDILTFSGLAAWDEILRKRSKKLTGCQRKRGVLAAGTSLAGELVFARRSLKKGRREGHEDRQERDLGNKLQRRGTKSRRDRRVALSLLLDDDAGHVGVSEDVGRDTGGRDELLEPC